MAEWCEGVAILLTGADLSQQTDSVTHGLLLRRIESSTQEVLWRTIFTLLFTHTEVTEDSVLQTEKMLYAHYFRSLRSDFFLLTTNDCKCFNNVTKDFYFK